MEMILKLIGLCLLTAVLTLLLRKDSAELSLLLTVSAVLLGILMLLSALHEVRELGTYLLDLTKLSPSLFVPLLKGMAIACVVRLGSALCADVGQSALSAVLEIGGAICALWCALPLLRAVVDMLEEWV
ncbi:MAG: SpoIIIAC/SpoIIIAD family protein [Eubacteriales bacterium]|nr:SpoIIIAC/SpoIIIAD family protein [Eubacteriales bacterium]